MVVNTEENTEKGFEGEGPFVAVDDNGGHNEPSRKPFKYLLFVSQCGIRTYEAQKFLVSIKMPKNASEFHILWENYKSEGKPMSKYLHGGKH